MLEIILNPDRTVEIPLIGTIVTVSSLGDKMYEVLSTVTYQERNTKIGQNPWTPTFSTYCTLLEVTDEGDDAGKPHIEVNAWHVTEI